MGTPTIKTDIAIIGGGIAGLWTLNQLRNRGYQAVLFEQDALGSQQTIGSQGMIHGGVKYALAGAWSGGSEAISKMPAIWRECLRGEGQVDLRACQILSEDFYLWSRTGLQSRVSSFFASKLLRGRVEKVRRPDFPAPLRNEDFRGQVYRLIDLVLDVPSLVQALSEQQRDAIFKIDWQSARLEKTATAARLVLPQCILEAKQFILSAGVGNEALMAQLGAEAPAMQRRPLQQVMVKHQYREPFYAHCMDGNASPRLTISSHRTLDNEPVWYLGGDLSTEGMDDEPGVLIDKARREMAELMPWLDLGETQWQTIRLDRAEPRQSALLRPDSAFVAPVEKVDNVMVAWPTKLSLTPDLASEIETELEKQDIAPGPAADVSVLQSLGQPGIAQTFWETAFK